MDPIQSHNGQLEVFGGEPLGGPVGPRVRARWVVVGLVFSVASLMMPAESSAELCRRTFAMRVSPAGFDLIAQTLLEDVPSSFAMPAFSTVLVDWPLTSDDARLQMDSTPSAITLHEVQATYAGEGLRLSGRADVSFKGPAVVTNAYVGFGRDTCQVNVQLPNLNFVLDLKLHARAGGMAVEVTNASVTSDLGRRVVDIGQCTVGEIYNSLANALGTQTEVGTRQWLEAYARDRLPRAIEAWLNQSAQATQATQGIGFTARVDEATTDYSGLVLRVNTGVASVTTGVASCVHGVTAAVAPACGDEPQLPSAKTGAMVSASASEGLVDDALYAIWRAGLLCLNSDAIGYAALSENLNKLAAIFGLPAGAHLWFKVSPQAPPRVRFSIQHGAQLTIERLGVQLNINSNGEGPSGQMGANIDIMVALKPWMDPATNSLSFDLGQMSLLRLQIQHAGGAAASLQLDPARMQRFVADIVLPLLRKQLNALPLSPSLAITTKYLVELQHAFVGDGYVEAHVNAFDRARADGDTQPPDTVLLDQTGPLVGPQILVIRAQGSDDRTPAGLLRFVARVDGGLWSEPQFGGRVEVVTHSGQHTVEVAAMDLAGNIDPSPIAATMLVDDSPPTLQITDRPESLTDRSSVRVGFVGEDDRTPATSLVFSADLYRVADNGGAVELLQNAGLSSGSRTAAFSGLEKGTYRIRVAVRDSAGNVTSEDVGVVITGGSCAVVRGTAVDPWAVLMIALGFGIWARRRRRATL